MGTHRTYHERKYAFGQQVLTCRRRAALTQIELAEQIDVHRRSVQNWETGESYPKAEALQRLIAVFLRHHAFTADLEHVEAHALWTQAAEDGPHALAAFDEAWFVALRAGVGDQAPGDGKPKPQHPTPNLHPPMIDWGESIAVPTLYGREDELQTLHQWVVADRCRVVAIVGLGGMGKSSLAITFAHHVVPQFDLVLFRSLQNGPPLAEALDQIIRAISDQQALPPDQVSDKIALLVQLFRQRRCLLILDNLESIMQPGALTGTFRTGYAEYGALLHALSEREHQSCLLLTGREKPAELGPLEGRTAPVRALLLTGLDYATCQIILEAKDIGGTADDVGALMRLYGGNPLALQLVAEPIRELFGGDVGAFLAAGDAFFNGVGKLLHQQFARSTPLEHAILYWLAIERELTPFSALRANMGDTVAQRDLLVALESLRHRMLIERGPNHLVFTLQPVILEYVTDHLVEAISQELAEGRPQLLYSHAIVQATAKEYVRRGQERLIATALLERLVSACGGANAAERQLLNLLASWRDQPLVEAGYGPGNLINLLRLRRGHLRGLDLAGLTIRQAYLQGVELQDTSLAGASVRDSIFTEAFGIIHAVAASPDGSYWAASSINGTIRVWRDDGRTTHLSILAHAKQVITLAFSPDGQTLASGSYDCTIKLWDMTSGMLIRILEGHSDYVQSVAFAPDGRLLVSGSDDRTIRLWDVASGACLQTLDAHTDNVYGVVWSPDGRLVVSCSFDLTLRVWDVASGACVQTLAGHTRAVSKLAFSPDGRLLASGGFDWAVKIWDVASGRCLQTFEEHTSTVKAIAWSPDGRSIASASYDATIRLWERNRDTAQRMLLGHAASVNSIAFTAAGSRLISGSDDHTVRVWDVASGWCVRVIQGYGLFFFAVVWSPDGQRLLSANSNATLTVWNVADGTAAQTLHGHTHTVYAAAWSPDGQWLASGGYDQTIRIWEATTGACVRIIPAHADIVYRTVWSPDGRSLASASRDQTVRIWNTATGVCRWVGSAHSDPINEVVWSPDGRRLASCGEDRTVRLWRAEDGMLLQTLVGHARSVAGIAWSPDGRRLASCGGGGSTGEVFLWDAESGEQVGSFIGHASTVFRVAWSMDGKVLLSGDMTGAIRWWDVPSGVLLHMRQGHQGWIRSLSRSPDGATLVSSGEDGIIQLWDIQRAELIRTLHIDRPYERLNITGISGLTEAQKESLRALGAADGMGDGRLASGDNAQLVDGNPPSTIHHPQSKNVAIGLPFQPTSFIGRAADLTAIASVLGDPACRLLTLLGPGGIGKTRLALAVVAGQIDAFADGVAFVALDSVGTPNQIVSAIGDTLNLSFAEQPDPTAHLLDYLRQRHMLLVLDNFEHLLDGADLVTDILQHAPRVTILVTSRERLNLQAEWLFDVDGLAYPQEDQHEPQSMADLAGYSAIQLFMQRATQVQPGFPLSEATLTAIVRICQHAAGIPLAIELAAAGMRTLPVAAIERQIRANLDVLATTLRDVPARHRSMRAVFDHSWNLLSEAERATVSRLAVFRGGWTADAAAAVLSFEFKVLSSAQNNPELKTQNSELLTLLAALVDKSLVRHDRAEPRSIAARAAPHGASDTRFVLLEPIREYAREQLVARGEAEALQRAHASYYLALAEGAVAAWGTATGDAAIAQLHREHDNMRATLQWARDSRERALGLQLAGALWQFWRSYGYTSEGRAWLEQLLTVEDTPSDPTAMAARQRGLHAAAWLASDQHDYVKAAQFFAQSMTLRRALGETEGETDLLLNAARQARAEGQYRRATALLEQALARRRAQGHDIAKGSVSLDPALYEFGQVLRELGLVTREQGDFVRATALFEESLAFHRVVGDRSCVAFALLGLADVARDQGNADLVREYGEESLAILRELGMQWAIGFALNSLALGAYHEDNLARAFALANESVAVFRGLKSDASLAEVLITLGQIVRAQGDRAAAYEALTEALRLAWALGPRLMVAAAMEGLAGELVQQGLATLAVQLLAAASALRAQMGAPVRPVDRRAVEHTLATARSTLGADAFAATWAAAAALPLEQLLATIRTATAEDNPQQKERSS